MSEQIDFYLNVSHEIRNSWAFIRKTLMNSSHCMSEQIDFHLNVSRETLAPT